MSAKILDRLISAFVGAVSAVGTVWFLNANAPSTPDASTSAPAKFDRLEVDELRITKALVVVDPKTQESTIKLSDGSISAQNKILAEDIGAFRVFAKKLQATPADPLNAQSPIFAELATNQDGGAYLALLSPQETHSITIGFDKTETGCLVSQNNDDLSMSAQAIFPKPTAADAVQPSATQNAVESNATTPAATTENPADALPPFPDLAPTATPEVAPLVPEAAPLPTPDDANVPGSASPLPGV